MDIDINDLTINQLRTLRAEFDAILNPPVSPVTVQDPKCPTLAPERIGKRVLVRSRGSGVWVGTLVDRMATAAGHSVRLNNARRIWSWTGASECSQLAETGPKGGKIGVSCAPVVHELLEEHVVSVACDAAIAAIPEWRS